MSKLIRSWLGGVMTGTLFLVGSGASAALVAGDSFLYDFDGVPEPAEGEYSAAPTSSGLLYPGGTSGQNPSVDGFTGAWYRPGSTAGTSLWTVVEGTDGNGLPHDQLYSQGGALEFGHTSSFSGGRALSRELIAPPAVAAGESVYMSVLMQLPQLDATSPAFTQGSVTIGFVSTEDDITTGPTGSKKASEGFRVGFSGDGTNMDMVYRSRRGLLSGNEPLITNKIVDDVTPGQTYLVIVKVTKDVVTGNANADDRVDIWINPADISSEAAASSPYVTLYDRSIGSAGSLSYLNVRGSYIGGEGALFDEVRLGTTWSDVAVLPPPPVLLATTANPEPITLGLGAMGLLAIGVRLAGRHRLN